MALISQIKQIVNDSFLQAVDGTTAVTNIDTTSIVSMGQTIDKYDLYEPFYKALTNRIVKTVYFVRKYNRKNRRAIMRDEHEFGAFVQKVYYKMPEVVDDEAWKVTEDAQTYTQSNPYDISTVIEIEASTFGGQGAWSIEIIRPVVQLKTAFLSDSAMLAFINGIYTTIENRMAKDQENLENLAVATSIANTYQSGYARDLLKEYNALSGESLTTANCMTSLEFLKYASMEIGKVVDFMGELTTVFNTKGYETFTTRDNMVIEVLTHFAKACDSYLQADTYHNSLTALPNYTTVPFWQGVLKGHSFDVCSSLSVKNEGLKSESPSNPDGQVDCGGVICFIHDIENVACYFGERRSWELYNPRSEVMIHGEKARTGYAVDGHANSAVFYVKGS